MDNTNSPEDTAKILGWLLESCIKGKRGLDTYSGQKRLEIISDATEAFRRVKRKKPEKFQPVESWTMDEKSQEYFESAEHYVEDLGFENEEECMCLLKAVIFLASSGLERLREQIKPEEKITLCRLP